MKRKAILTTALALLLCSCNNELIALKDCPHEMDGIKVELSQSAESVQKISISKDGKFLQELVGEIANDFYSGSTEVFDESIVFFVDANFDNETDIFIGTEEGRCNNSLLLWNTSSNSFERCGKYFDPFFCRPLFSYSDKRMYTMLDEIGPRSNVYEYIYSEYSFKGTELIFIESLHESITGGTKYYIEDKDGNTITETDNINDLPLNWRTILSEYASVYEKLEDDTYSDDTSDNSQNEQSKQAEFEENIKKQVYEILNEENGWKIVDSPNSINDLKEGNDGKYTARFTDYGEYEHITYDLFIDVDNDGNVQSIRTKMYRITPTDKKPDGTADPNEIMRRKIQGLQY